MKKDPLVFVMHILESIELLEQYTKSVTQKQFEDREQLQDAVCRRMEIIGEATKNLPDNFKSKYPSIEWRKMAGMRDVLVHRYFGVSLSVMWNILKKDLQPLKRQLQKIKKDLDPS